MMRERPAKIEIQVAETHVDLWYDFQTYLRIWIDADGISICAPKFDEINWVDMLQQPGANARPIEVQALVRKKEFPMALPRLVADRLEDGQRLEAPKREKENRSSGNSSGPLTDKHTVDICINMVLDSLLARPDQSHAYTISESHRIAKELGMKVGSVAAVRANMTRGSYGDPEVLLSTRASYLRRNAPLRQAQRS